jgi:exodeoxyribonuclease VII large subunit
LVHNHIHRNESKLRSLATRAILEDPARLLESPTQLLDDVYRDLDAALDKWFERTQQIIQSHAQMLEALSPLKTLARGYSLTRDKVTGKIVNSVESVKVGQAIVTRIASGEIESVVTEKTSEEADLFRHE